MEPRIPSANANGDPTSRVSLGFATRRVDGALGQTQTFGRLAGLELRVARRQISVRVDAGSSIVSSKLLQSDAMRAASRNLLWNNSAVSIPAMPTASDRLSPADMQGRQFVKPGLFDA